ncbi:DegT/DnrJ/EryC1/StrS family aminotransferase [Carboxylicivirga sp. N1Y90]|uniref:DegT/DnrJ/EryC1/StrS family aminotransferase n=1 Tax=Carboxylicivirga fragile TaxID=3417571 RepID=UPI003D3380EA|nr:DegT/DnrJ/EryC1/StrS family aminotransferase [Marinilabiliaceae bacterium N1Y90]
MNSFIPISIPSITPLEHAFVNKAVTSGWVSSMGQYIDQFETEFATFCGVKHAISVSNGTVAIHLALAAMGIKEGDEVIIPDLTFIATASAVKLSGAKPVFVDIEDDTLGICPSAIRKAISPKTKAIMPVHLYGQPANMNAILDIAKEFNLKVIEDAAEAHGALIGEKKVGSIGHAGTFSFYGNKIITTGEGGMITTNDDELNERCRILRDHAMDKNKRYWHNELGYNYRMTNMQAALGCAQMQRISELIAKRKQIFDWYNTQLVNIDNIKLNQSNNWSTPVYWMICLEHKYFNEESRQRFMDLLKANNIDSRPYFYPISDMPMFKNIQTDVTHHIYSKGINLPTFHDITEEQVDYICKTIVKLLPNFNKKF